MGLLIKNGEMITATDRLFVDIYCENERVTQIGPGLTAKEGDTVIDAQGKWVIPGGIDVHTHLDLPFMGTVAKDDFESGTIAAAAGGTTSIIDFVIPSKKTPLMEAYKQWMEKAEGKAIFDYGFHMAVTWWDDSVKKELEKVFDTGMTSFKVFLAYKGAIGVEESELYQIIEVAQRLGGLTTVHAENAEIIDRLSKKLLAEGKTSPLDHARSRPPEVEEEGINRALTLAYIHKAPIYFVHMSCALGVEKVRDASFKGRTVYGETCPQYLLLDETYYERPNWEGAKWVMSPPLREKSNQEALWNGLKNGLIQTVTTDHCPFDFCGQKDMSGKNDFSKIPNGIPGIEDRMLLMYTYGVTRGRFDVHKWIELCCSNPARIFNLYPKKGTIQVGSDADLVVFDPHYEGVISQKTSHHRVDYSAFEGFPVKGKVTHTTVRGTVVWENGTFKGKAGFGKYLSRLPKVQGSSPAPV
jgi:dihydropyrimidinase